MQAQWWCNLPWFVSNLAYEQQQYHIDHFHPLQFFLTKQVPHKAIHRQFHPETR